MSGSTAGENAKSCLFSSFDKISHLLDPIFATALVAQGVLVILFHSEGTWGIGISLLVGYYFFFALLLYYSMIGKAVVHKYLGFMKGTFAKGLFYVFLATLSLGTTSAFAWSWAFAIALGVCAGMNMFRYFGRTGDIKNDEPML